MRAKKLVGALTALAIALMTMVIAIPSASASAADEQFANRMFALINDYRSQHSLAPLRWNAQMSAESQSWTQQSADIANVSGAGGFVHSPGSYSFHENIVWNMSADQAFTWWVNSPAHRANMLGAADTDIGIGAVQLTSGPNNGVFLATAKFGSTSESAQQIAAEIAAQQQAAIDQANADKAQAEAERVAAEKTAAAQAAADKLAAEQAAAAQAADKAASDKAAADKAAADKLAAEQAAPVPAPVPAAEQVAADKAAADKLAAEQVAADKAAAEQAAADKAAAEQAAADKAAADKLAAEQVAADKAAIDQAAADKAAAEQAAIDQAAAVQVAALQPTDEQIAADNQALAELQAAAEQEAVLLAARLEAEEEAAAAAAASAAEQAAPLSRSSREVAAPVATALALELGDESLLTAANAGALEASTSGSGLRIGGLAAGGSYEVVIPEAQVNLGAKTTNANGALSLAIPAVLGAGEHKAAVFQDGTLVGWTSFVVEAAVSVLAAPVPAAADGTYELASTGLSTTQQVMGGLGALMALMGAGVLVVLQRQQKSAAS